MLSQGGVRQPGGSGKLENRGWLCPVSLDPCGFLTGILCCGIILELYWGYIGRAENKMEITI